MIIPQLFQTKRLVFSLEVFPPQKTSSIDTIYKTLANINNLPADYISVTYGAGGSDAQRKKTCEIASLIKSEYGIEPLAHLTCISSDRDEISDTLSILRNNNVMNIMALRGDINPRLPIKHDFKHASDLARFIKEFDGSFSVVGACYPEAHFECSNTYQDIENLKIKIDAGVGLLITQLFFDNDVFYDFREKTAAAGITVPIEVGIMPITKKSQIEKTVSMCGASVPHRFAVLINRYSDDPDALRDAGIAYATEQIINLIANGVPGIHIYTMNDIEVAQQIYGNIRSIINSVNK